MNLRGDRADVDHHDFLDRAAPWRSAGCSTAGSCFTSTAPRRRDRKADHGRYLRPRPTHGAAAAVAV